MLVVLTRAPSSTCRRVAMMVLALTSHEREISAVVSYGSLWISRTLASVVLVNFSTVQEGGDVDLSCSNKGAVELRTAAEGWR